MRVLVPIWYQQSYFTETSDSVAKNKLQNLAMSVALPHLHYSTEDNHHREERLSIKEQRLFVRERNLKKK
jgi:hypothetical protein